MGFLGRLREGLARTTRQFVQQLESIGSPDASGRGRPSVDVDTIDALEELLIGADVGVGAAGQIVAAVQARAGEQADLTALVRDEIGAIFAAVPDTAPGAAAPLRVVLVVGVNGVGKTTTVGKLARLLKGQGGHPLICAADTYRAAASEQLEVWAERAGVEIVQAREGADPAAVVFDAIQSARARGRDIVLVDTAGRLHTRVNLMHELEKIRRVSGRALEGAPHDVLLVLDATVGQNGLVQAREFLSAVGVNGIILTKLDGTAKGGVAVAIAHDLRLPIRYVGVGEGIDDLIPFSADDYVDALFERPW